MQTYKYSMKRVDLCKFTEHSPDVLEEKAHLRFVTKILSKKVRLLCLLVSFFFMIARILTLNTSVSEKI